MAARPLIIAVIYCFCRVCKLSTILQKFDDEEVVNEKCATLADMIKSSKHVVVHTGAGISTSAGIPDFRGPNGVWTLEEKGEKPSMNIAFEDAVPTKTHMALKALIDAGHVKYVVSQNIDGLHMKSGLSREHLSELHGNIFVENCNKCRTQYVRTTAAPTVGQKPTGNQFVVNKIKEISTKIYSSIKVEYAKDEESNALAEAVL